MIQQQRIRQLNNKPVKPGDYVLYWMQAAQRTEYNHALEYTIRRANELNRPVIVVFGLTDDYPQANLRHYHFMLTGLKEVKQSLEKKGIIFVIKHSSPELAVLEMSDKAAITIVDAGWTKIQQKWRKHVARKINCLLEEVETNLILPIMEVTDKENFSAGTLRPRINAKLPNYLVKLKHTQIKHLSLDMNFESFDISNIDHALAKLKIDHSVKPVKNFKAGTSQAKKLLKDFIKNKLNDYDTLRNDPCKNYTSNMSPYLHFGQISPLYIALEVSKSTSKGKAAYIEELIVRRELSHNFIYYNDNYDKLNCLPCWAMNTLNFHRKDKREYVYTLEQFEKAKTHDIYWNAAQKEMVITGKMHGYMRMYWGKKILEWSKNPREGFKIAVYLNNKYELDGRDANGYAGVAWCFGKHDRAWSERKVFGKIRYMNAAGLKRKFDRDKYVEKINSLSIEEQ